ncbi:MAG: spore cortex biosynthesis protein YabQ [Lachnospiraceae bacterium]|nr:spore cortex biosynthesis protein YabQ [Lachnospiraceae bacterium]
MEEVYFFLHSLLMGVMITFVYDVLIIFRQVIRHNHFCISLEDLLFWIVCAIGIFAMLYQENNGVPRWFAIVGAAVGMMLYKVTFSRLFIKLMTKVLTAVLHAFVKVVAIMVKPFAFAGRKMKKCSSRIGVFFKKIGRFFKKKLTVCRKVFRIILCKR